MPLYFLYVSFIQFLVYNIANDCPVKNTEINNFDLSKRCCYLCKSGREKMGAKKKKKRWRERSGKTKVDEGENVERMRYFINDNITVVRGRGYIQLTFLLC